MDIYAKCSIIIDKKSDALIVVEALNFFCELADKNYSYEQFLKYKDRFSYYNNIGERIHALYDYVVNNNDSDMAIKVVSERDYDRLVNYFSCLREFSSEVKDEFMEGQMVLSVRYLRFIKDWHDELKFKIDKQTIECLPEEWQKNHRLLSSLEKARLSGLLDRNFFPTEKLKTNDHKGYLVYKIAEDAMAAPGWKVFEKYWGISHLSQAKNRALNGCSSNSGLGYIDSVFE